MNVIGVISYFPLESAYIKEFKKYTDILEIRADLIQKDYHKAIRKFSKIKPIIITVRAESEGGMYIPYRKQIYLEFIDEVDFVDIELSSLPEFLDVVQIARSKGKKVILSYHSFDGRVNDRELDKLFRRAELDGGDIFKAAVFSTSYKTIVELALWARRISFKNSDTLLSLMCMGHPKISLISRIVLPVFGSKFVYGRVGREGSAPGQPSVSLLYKILKSD